MGPVESEIIARLTAGLQPARLTVHNDSSHHLGHAGHDGSGESHFTIEVVSDRFAGMGRVARQRAVNQALGDLVHRIHALSVRALAPGEGQA